MFSWDTTHVCHIKPRLCRTDHSQKFISLNLESALFLFQLIFTRLQAFKPALTEATLDSNEAHYRVEKNYKATTWVQECKHSQTNTRTSHPLHCVSIPEKFTTQLAVPSLLPSLCIYHSETNGLLAQWHFNEPWGVCRKNIYQHSFISIHHCLLTYTHAHTSAA